MREVRPGVPPTATRCLAVQLFANWGTVERIKPAGIMAP